MPNLTRLIETGSISPESILFLADHPHFEERPIPADVFIRHKDYLNCPEAWPEVVAIASELFSESTKGERLSKYSEFVFKAGIGSGKSFLVSCIFSYAVYWLSCLRDPQKFFGLAPGSTICLINTATTAPQAKKIVFGKIGTRVENSPWFQKHACPNPSVRSELRFPKKIVVFPGSSSETAPIGYDILIANIDEASFFVETDARNSAQEVADTLQRRIDSRFGDLGMLCVTSSPRYVDDYTEKKFDESKTFDKILGIGKATWEMRPADIDSIKSGDCFEIAKPGAKKDSPTIKIPNRYKRAFDRNPKKAWRDFGGLASLTLDAFFSEEEIGMLERICESSKSQTPIVENRINPSLKPVSGARYKMHIDLGIVRDACGIAMGHAEGDCTIIDLIIRAVCEQRARELQEKGEQVDLVLGREYVPIDDVLKIVFELIGIGFGIELVTFDNFQSLHSRQKLIDSGIASELLSVDKNTEAYDTLLSLVRLGKIKLPNHSTFIREAKRLELREGKKIDHPPKVSKDCTDAVAGVVKSIADEQAEEVEHEEVIHDETIRIDISGQI